MSDFRSLADDATNAACKMLLEGGIARQSRFGEIRKNEDQYNGVAGAALKGRSNIPFDGVVMGGFIDTITAAVMVDVSFKFGHTREQDKRAADKLSAAATIETADDRGAWNRAIQDARFLGSLSGRGFLKPVFSSVPRFRADLYAADHNDVITEPTGGRYLDKHLYAFEMNIFRDASDLDAAAGNFYDLHQVRLLKARQYDETYQKRIMDEFYNKAARLTGFGINFDQNSYVGTTLFNLVEGKMKFRGQWYYILFDPKLKTWVRFEPLTEVFEHAKEFPGRGAMVSFATHPHPFLFWSKAPADDVRPIAYTMKKLVNLTVDNLEKRNWDQRAYDPKIFRQPSQLLWKRDGLVRASLKPGQNIESGIFQFQTPDTTGITINLAQWLDNFLGQKTGITADAQGSSKEDKVGILVSNIQQVSKRLSLTNRSFRDDALVPLGVMLDYGFYEYLREPMAVKLLGPKGASWDEEITRRDTEREFSITVSDGTEQAQQMALEIERKSAGFDRMAKDPDMRGALNVQWKTREYLSMMGYDDEETRIALDTKNDADADILSKAAQAIADCLEGKDLYIMHQDATSGFVQKILDFCNDNYPLIPADILKKESVAERRRYAKRMVEHDKLMEYAMQHIPIAQKNAVRSAVSVIAERGQTALPAEGAALPGTGLPGPMQAGPGNAAALSPTPVPGTAAPLPVPGQ